MLTRRVVVIAAALAAPSGWLRAQEPASTDPDMCAFARAHLQQETDSILALKPADWQPAPGEDSLAAAVGAADVVIQVRVDTMGRPDFRSFRAVRSRDLNLVRVARQELGQLDLDPYEVIPGCRAAFLLTLPMRFSEVRRY